MAYDSNSNSFWFYELCPHCHHKFFYISHSNLFKAYLDKQKFKLLFAMHKSDCINNKVEKTLNGNLRTSNCI